MMHRSSLPTERQSIFTDRGNLLSAAAALLRIGIVLHLKYCLEHMIRNVFDHFKITRSTDKKQIRSLMAAVQESATRALFFKSLSEIGNVEFADDDNQKGQKIVIYLLTIHPIHWVVWANPCLMDPDDWMPDYQEEIANLVGSHVGEPDCQNQHLRWLST